MSGNNNPGNVPPGDNPPIGNNANNGWVQQDNGASAWETGVEAGGSWTAEVRIKLAPDAGNGFVIWAANGSQRGILQINTDSVAPFGLADRNHFVFPLWSLTMKCWHDAAIVSCASMADSWLSGIVMPFLLRLAWHDLRGSGQSLWVLCACLVLGVTLVAATGGL